MADQVSILILGATGYIGGSILSELLKSPSYQLSALVRKPEQAEKLREVGVNGILFESLDDIENIRDAAKQHDIVIAAASARHMDCARACIQGLGQRQSSSGHKAHYIHTSGASMIGDWPESGGRVDTSIHSDVDEDIFGLENSIPEHHSPVRMVNQFVVETGKQEGVHTYIVAPPLIFGRGTGLFTEGTGQVHQMIQLALKKGQSVMIGSGSGIWNRVHINDLAVLYSMLLQHILKLKDIPSGKSGYYFAENGFQSWESIARSIGKIGYDRNIFQTDEVADISLQEVAKELYNDDVRDAEGVLASNARTKADKARQMFGWQPQFAQDSFDHEIVEVFTIMTKSHAGS